MGLNLKKKLKKIGGAIEDISPDPIENLAKRTGNAAWTGLNEGSKWGTGSATALLSRPQVEDQSLPLAQQKVKARFSLSNASPLNWKRNVGEWQSQKALEHRLNGDPMYQAPRFNPVQSYKDVRSLSKQWDESNLPQGAKVAGSIAFDPTMVLPAGAIGKLSTKTGLAGTKAGKLFLGSEKAGATSRTARLLGGLIEGAPEAGIGIAAGAGLGSQLSSMTSNKYDDMIVPFIGGALGARSLEGKDAFRLKGTKNNVIEDSSGKVFKSLEDKIVNDPKLPNSANSDSWKSILNARGIKKQELLVNGLDDEFFNSKSKITKEDILNRIRQEDFDVEEFQASGRETPYGIYTVPGGEPGTYRDIVLKQKNNKNLTDDNQWDGSVIRGHGEDSGKNVLAHMRVDDRDGGKTLFVHEIQSDWAQENRSGNQVHVSHIDAPKTGGITKDEVTIKKREYSDSYIVQRKDTEEVIGVYGRNDYYKTLDDVLNDTKQTIPYPHPFQNNWQELTLKRLLRYAADKGYEKIKFASGDQTLAIKGMELPEERVKKEFGTWGRDVLDESGRPIMEHPASGRRKSYDEILPNKIRDLAKKYGISVSQEEAENNKFETSWKFNDDFTSEEVRLVYKDGIRWEDAITDNDRSVLHATADLIYDTATIMERQNLTFSEAFNRAASSYDFAPKAIDMAAKLFDGTPIRTPIEDMGFNTVVNLDSVARERLTNEPQSYYSALDQFKRKLGREPENIVDSGRGKAGLLRVIEDSNLSPEAKAFSTHFANSIPEKYVDMLRTLFVGDNKSANKSGVFGVYTPDNSTPIMRIYTESIKAAENAPPEIKATYVDRVVAHELSHHLQSFMTTEDLDALVKMYDDEYANASKHADDLLESGSPQGQTLKSSQAETSGYRFTNFNEWFAEKMTDAAHEQWRSTLPKSISEKIKQLVEVMHDISAAIFGFSSARNTDEFKNLLAKFQQGEQQTGRSWVHIGPPASEYRSAISDTDMAAIGKMIDEGINPQASIPPGTELDAIAGEQPGVKQGLRPKFKPGENMRKVNSSASAKAASLPIVGNLTKVVRQNVQRVTERQGAWIKATDLGEAPVNYGNNRETVNFLTRSARTLNRQVESGKNVLSAQAQEALSAFKIGADGFVKNVKPSAKDVADGIKNPSFYRIVDFANEYALTKQQKEALKTFTGLADQVAAEKALHGMELPQTQAPQGFFASRGVQVNRAVEPHDFRRKITNEAQNSRGFKDPNDFIKAGGKYEKPLTAFSGYVENHFKDIANRTMQDLLDPLGSERNVKGYALPMEIAPSLQGKTFDKRIAQAMIDQYSNAARLGGMSLSVRAPLVRGINSALLPIKITLDMGASLINQGGMAYSHPGAYIKNMALTTRDMFNQKAYHEWLKSDKVKDASAHGVSLHFEPSQIEDYAAGTLLTKGKYNPFRPLAEHFTILNNRMRVDTYNSIIEVNRALGNELDDTGKEAVARAINRFTGISEGRATDLEQTLMFAPNFFRSQIENVKLALTSGSIDGQLARKYMSNYLAMSGALAYSTAALQGRDPSEVMSPIDLDKFRKDGVIALNPNFYTVRIMDQDVRLLGPYTTLAGIMMGAVEAASLSYKDPQGTSNYLEDYLLRLANTKGAPVTSMAADVKRGETITRVPVNSPEYLFRQVMPISLGQAVEPGQINSAIDNGDFSQLFASSPDGQQLTWEQKLFGGVMNFLGGNTSQKSGSELREQRSQSMFGKGFDELNNEQKRELFNTYPITRDNSDPLTKMYNDIDAVEVKFIDDLNEKQALVESGVWSKQDFREWYKVRNQERIVAVEQARISSGESEIHRYGFTGTLQKYLDRPKNLTPEDKAVKDWYALTDRFIKPEGFDYDGLKKAREDFLDNLSPEIYGYVTRNTKPTDPTGGIVDEMKAAQDKVSKYFEAEKIVYDKFSTASPLMKSFGSPEGIDKFINVTAGKLGLTPATTVAMMEKAIPEFKVYNSVLSEYQRLLRLSDPNMDKALTDWYGFEPANRFGYILSQYGTDAGYTLNPAIAENKGLNDRSSAYNFALEQYVQGKLKSKPRYSLIKSNRLEE